jgi:hypothetical protein
MNESDKDPLLEALGRLPKDVQPPRDLWSDIAQEIASSTPKPRRSVTRWAAAFAGIAFAAALSYYALRPTTPTLQSPSQTAHEQPAVTPSWFNAEITPVALGPEYQQARLTLATDLFRHIQRLSPEERAKVELGLKQIDEGLRSIGEALQAHPDSILLQQLVLSAYQQELQFMQDVSTTTNAALGRSTT